MSYFPVLWTGSLSSTSILLVKWNFDSWFGKTRIKSKGGTKSKIISWDWRQNSKIGLIRSLKFGSIVNVVSSNYSQRSKYYVSWRHKIMWLLCNKNFKIMRLFVIIMWLLKNLYHFYVTYFPKTMWFSKSQVVTSFEWILRYTLNTSIIRIIC